jgi:hypothetical protein
VVLSRRNGASVSTDKFNYRQEAQSLLVKPITQVAQGISQLIIHLYGIVEASNTYLSDIQSQLSVSVFSLKLFGSLHERQLFYPGPEQVKH